jgi:hypothetical protein
LVADITKVVVNSSPLIGVMRKVPSSGGPLVVTLTAANPVAPVPVAAQERVKVTVARGGSEPGAMTRLKGKVFDVEVVPPLLIVIYSALLVTD